MSDIVIRARQLSKRYDLGRKGSQDEGFPSSLRKRFSREAPEEFWALKDISFEVPGGQVIGIIGNNGAGKSTLLKVLSRITEPTGGSVEIRGRVGSLLEVGTGFHPELTGRENIYLNGVIIGMQQADIRKKFADIVEFAGVENFLDTPVKRYSSGMYMRLAFSVAAHLDPDILIIDEVLAVGDASFQKKCLGKLHDVATQSKRTVLFVSHNLQAVQSLCDQVIHLDHGRIVAFGDTRTVVGRYLETTSTAVAGSHYWDHDAPGNDEIRLKSIEVKSSDNSNGIYSSSQDLTVEMGFEVSVDVPGLRVGFDLVTPEGVLIFRTYQTDTVQKGFSRLGIGPNRWRCTLPAGLLNAGVYTVLPKVAIDDTHWIIDGSAGAAFEVVLDHGISPYWNSLDASSRPGLIAPILDWKTVSVPARDCVIQGWEA
ncbi:MAG: transporter related [Bryobacterales bacterium]|nr:transporter related [Bryobacterales bacterium]